MTLPLDTAPGPSPDEESARNAEISRELLQKARLELDKGDLLQASEKAWGAAAYAVKAVAEKRRWFSEADWKLGRIATVLTYEQQDDDILRCYQLARDAHFNYYHHEYDALRIDRAIVSAAKLVEILETVLVPGYTPPYVNEEVEASKRSLEQPTSEPDNARLKYGRSPISERPPVIPPASETAPENGATRG
jgi:hypothetical protein